MSLRVLIGLIACNLVWSAHPAMGKLVLADYSPAIGAWLRYSGAFLAYVLAWVFLRARPAWRAREFFCLPPRAPDRILVVLLGFMTFCFSPLMTMTGLANSRATDNALIVAMEPLMAVALAWIFLKERLGLLNGISFAVALAGFGLLSAGHGEMGEAAGDGAIPLFWANLLLLVSLVGEATFSVAGRKLIFEHAPVSIFGTALAVGVAFLTLATPYFAEGLSGAFAGASWKSFLALLWLGPLGTTAAYLFWILALSEAPVASVALTLFIQPVFGALWGNIFLGERLGGIQISGAILILGAVFLQTYGTARCQRGLGRS